MSIIFLIIFLCNVVINVVNGQNSLDVERHKLCICGVKITSA